MKAADLHMHNDNLISLIQNYDHPIFEGGKQLKRHDLSEKDASTKIISYICISLNSTHYGS